MARAPSYLALAACLCFSVGCGHEARVAVRNTQAAGEFLAEQGPDDIVRAAGRSIAIQAKASADQMDLLLWGLLARKTEPTISVQDWKDSPVVAERLSEKQAIKVERETARIQAVAGSIFESFGLSAGLAGSGFLGLALAFALKNRSTIQSLISYAASMRKAETEDDAKKVEEANPLANKVIAKAKAAGKVS